MTFISVKTDIPGSISQSLLMERKDAIARGINTTIPIFVDKAEGALVTDVDGNTFIDLGGGIGSLNVGHTPSAVKEALKEQLDRFIHPVFHVTMYESYIRLAQKLNALTPGDFSKKTALFNSGAEAVENAVKIARRYTGRRAVIAFERGFHGRTLLSMTLTSKVKSFKAGFGPMATDVYRVPYPYYYRDERSDKELLQSFHRLFQSDVDPNDVAAVIMEPIQGDGGFIVPSTQFVQGVRDVCNQNGIVFIADEVQTGFARTGRWFAMENYDVVPDLIVMSKSLAAGVPLSAVTGKVEIMDSPEPKELGGTLGGSPLGCAAALSVIEFIETRDLLKRAQSIGSQIRERLKVQSKYIGEVRGIGAMIGIEFVTDKTTKEPNPDFVRKVVQECYRRGVIVITAGAQGNIIRLLPPLVLTDEQLSEAMDVLVDVIRTLEGVVQHV